MKKCSNCKEEKPLDMFYNNKSSKDKKGRICKVCRAINGRLEQSKRYLYQKEYHKRDYVQEKAKIRVKLLRKSNSLKIKARKILQNNIYKGLIEKPSECSVCNKITEKRYIHGHHDDYLKPLDVIWCCRLCHEKIHKKKSKYIG